MARLLIVDDEALIRNGIRQAVPWSELGITETRTAGSGEEALQLLADFAPEIVLTDIRMPGMDGLELLAAVKERQPGAKVIILSGYDEFAYARSALKLGAFDYLLKTSDMADLMEVIRKANAVLRSEREQQLRLSKGLPLLREELLRRLIYHGRPDDSAMDELSSLGLAWETGRFTLAVIDLGGTDLNIAEEQQYRKLQLLELCEAVFGTAGVGFEGRYDELVWIQRQSQEGLDQGRFEAACARLIELASAGLGTGLSLGFSVGEGDPSLFKDLFQQAKQALEYGLLSGKTVTKFEEVPAAVAGPGLVSSGQEQVLMSALRTGDKELLLRTLAEIFAGLSRNGPPRIAALRQAVIDLFGRASQVIREFQLDWESLFGKEFLYFEAIAGIRSLDAMKQWAGEHLEAAADHIRNTKILKNKKVIEDAKAYLAQHYAEPLTLNRLAEVVHMSPNYFSSVFSNEVGVSFLEHLTALRIEKAKQLLGEKDARAFEVGERVGYENPQYFSKIFKKYTGLSPSEYKEHLQRTI
jgi:two-component system response regulator YesN